MKFMYESLEGIYGELLMIDERSRDPKKYKTVGIPVFIRVKIKDYIINKAMKSLKKHLDSKPLLDYSYIKDFFEFFKRTFNDTTPMYKTIPSRLKFEHGFDEGGEQYIKLFIVKYPDMHIMWHQSYDTITVYDSANKLVMNSTSHVPKTYTLEEFNETRYSEDIRNCIKTYAMYYLKTYYEIK